MPDLHCKFLILIHLHQFNGSMKPFRTILLVTLLLGIFLPAFAQKQLSKTMMVPYVDNSGRDVTLTWLTDTGKSVFYTWVGNITNYAPYNVNLPEAPISPVTGTVMMVPYVDKAGRDVVLIWDTGNGKSIFYSWDNNIDNWAAYEINLPESPLAGVQGPIMMQAYVDNSGRDVVLIWDTQSGKSVFYAWVPDIKNWSTFQVNLPEVPVRQ